MRMAILGASLLVAVLAACGSSTSSSSGADCTSLCNAAQMGNCTTITGNCGTFCSSLSTVVSEASCTSAYNSYESCLGTPATVCANSCGAQDQALQNCVNPYCAAHTTDTNCQTVAGSF
jgi:hypothetical protein